ncbi:MAG: hypothetical protein ACRCT8_06830 [Lacipirellulaceae bacterium]
MGNRLYTGGVVLLWLASMTWLVSARILPPFFEGEPPVSGLARQDDPVAWGIRVDGAPCGLAVLQAVDGGMGTKEVHSWLTLTRVPRPKGAPSWLAGMLDTLRTLSLTIRTRTAFDPLGRLTSFHTDIGLNDLESHVYIHGRVEKDTVRLRLRTGTYSKEIEQPWPADARLANELTPESKLLGVFPGQRWRKEVYSPFGSPTNPLEMIEAHVVDELRITHEKKQVLVKKIEYRAVEPTGKAAGKRLRGTLYVADDGRVIRQEVFLLGSKLEFERLSDRMSEKVADERLDLNRYASTRVPEWSPGSVPEQATSRAATDASSVLPSSRPPGAPE